MAITSPQPDPLVVPFGVARLTEANRDVAPRVVIDRSTGLPLRLGDGPYPRRLISEEANQDGEAAETGDGELRLAILRRVHLRHCDTFDKYLRRWVDLYFDHLAARANSIAQQSGGSLQGPGGDFDPALWAMAALRPLPRAHLPGVDGELTGVDAAFWDGAQFTAIVFSGGGKASRAQALGRDTRLLTIDTPDDSATPEAIAAALGGDDFVFSRGILVPPDPFGPAPFRLGDRAAPSF